MKRIENGAKLNANRENPLNRIQHWTLGHILIAYFKTNATEITISQC